MSSGPMIQQNPQQIVACTISRDVQIFDLLIEDMEAALGDAWGDLGFEDAAPFFGQPDSDALQFVTIAMDAQDEDNVPMISGIIAAAKAKDIKVILIAEDVSPAVLHQLLREGGDEFVPYPLPERELGRAIERVLMPVPEATPSPGRGRTSGGDKSGIVIPIHGMAGGTGATTLAVNMAWELATISKKEPPMVCLLDLDFQFGSVSTYLDLPRRETVLELLTDTEGMTDESFMDTLLAFEEKMHVLTAPSDLVPLDIIGSEDVARLIDMARSHFDYVIIDMPSTMVEWSQAVLEAAHVYFATMELDMRSAQNTLRIKRALQSEDLPFDKLRFVLNRAPGFADLNGKSRVKRLSESLGISIEVLLPDGGKPVTQSADHGVPLADQLGKNPLRKEIQKLAQSVHAVNQADMAEANA